MERGWQWCGQCGFKRKEGGPCPHCATYRLSVSAYMGKHGSDREAVKDWLKKYKPQIDARALEESND